MSLLKPERFFSRISRIDVQADIVNAGFTHVLLDIDNTILTRDTHEVPRDVMLWLNKVRSAGVHIGLLSNNWHASVYDLARELDLPIVAKAVKPCPPAFIVALRRNKAKRKSTVMIGDQLMTDVLGAHLVGMSAYLLTPLVEKDLKHTLLLRNVERVLLGDMQPEDQAEGQLEGQPEGAFACADERSGACVQKEGGLA